MCGKSEFMSEKVEKVAFIEHGVGRTWQSSLLSPSVNARHKPKDESSSSLEPCRIVFFPNCRGPVSPIGRRPISSSRVLYRPETSD